MSALRADPDVETASEEYAARFSGAVGSFLLEVQTSLTLELLAAWPGARVLDVGGGHGQIAAPLVGAGYEVTVAGSKEVCRRRLDRLLGPGSFDYRTCNLLALPFADNSYDVVVSFRLLSHVGDWRQLLSEMCRVATSVVLLDYPDRRSFNFVQPLFFSWKRALEGNTRRYRSFTRAELRAELARHQFGGVLFRPEFFIPMVLHRVLKNARASRLLESICRTLGLTQHLGSPVILRGVASKAENRQTEQSDALTS